jgi:hypothetical protein
MYLSDKEPTLLYVLKSILIIYLKKLINLAVRGELGETYELIG